MTLNDIILDNEIKSLANLLLSNYRKEIGNGHMASGRLANSSKVNLSTSSNSVIISFNVADYYKYLENGTKPHFPPISAIKKWIELKHIVPRPYKNLTPSNDQLAFMIARKISKVGTKAYKPLQKSIINSESIIDDIANRIAELLETELDSELKEFEK